MERLDKVLAGTGRWSRREVKATVLELLPAELRRRGLSPVGRLDKDTEGLLLLTDDGELAHRLLSPKHHVDKRYYARVDGALGPEDVAAFASGMTLGDGLECLPAGLEPLEPGACIVTLREGKFHQVKRMLAARGAPVLAQNTYAWFAGGSRYVGKNFSECGTAIQGDDGSHHRRH